jgi:hypothetical protein
MGDGGNRTRSKAEEANPSVTARDEQKTEPTLRLDQPQNGCAWRTAL